MERWNARIALVTGASGGIGAAVCKELVKHGMIVVGCARRVEKIKELAESPEMSSYPGKLHAMKCDVSEEKEILAMFDEIRKEFKRIDVCINNAGVCSNASLLYGETCDWKHIIKVNVLGTCMCTREAVKLMREAEVDGQIIQMGSIIGHKVPKDTKSFCLGIYYGTKFMIRALAEALREELKAEKPRIRVAVISPGAVETELLAKIWSSEVAASFFQSTECLQPEDVANEVIHILKSPQRVNIDDVIVQPLQFRI